MTTKSVYHICLITELRIFEFPHGVQRFTLSLGKWFMDQNHIVTVMGSTFAGITTKRLSKKNLEEKNKTNNKKIKAIFPPWSIYMISRFILSIMWFFKILTTNRKTPITLIHAL